MNLDVNVLTTGWTIAGVIASFLVAAVALGLGVLSLIQTQRLQKRERKERLLNDIIEWAVEVSSWRSESAHVHREIIRAVDFKQSQLLYHAHIAEVLDKLVTIRVRNHYISEIAEKYKGYLHWSVKQTIDDITAYIDFLDEWYIKLGDTIAKNEIDEEGNKVQADALAQQLEKSASMVLEEATKIKTKGIS